MEDVSINRTNIKHTGIIIQIQPKHTNQCCKAVMDAALSEPTMNLNVTNRIKP